MKSTKAVLITGITWIISVTYFFPALWMLINSFRSENDAILPLFISFKNLRVLDNIFALSLVYAVMNLPIAIWMMRYFLGEVPPFLASFVDGRGQFLAVLSAASTVAALPVILAGWFAQKQLVRGLAMGAVK